MRLACLALVLAAACGATDDDWVIRPPGGGTGGTGYTIDAAPPIDAAELDGSVAGLTGLICVVTDLQMPDACPPVATAADVMVGAIGSSAVATSGADGRFTLPVSDPIVVLEVGLGPTLLQPSLVPVANVGLVHAPVAPETVWNATLADANATVTPGNGSIALYVDAAAGGPAAAVLVDLPVGAVQGPFYDGTPPITWTTAGGTGPLGVALLVDLAPGTYPITGAQAGHTFSLPAVPVAADTVTFVRARLSP